MTQKSAPPPTREGGVAKAWIDESTCIGSGSCVRLAKGAFVMDDERGVAVVADLGAVDERRLVGAERSCPTGAIFLERT